MCVCAHVRVCACAPVRLCVRACVVAMQNKKVECDDNIARLDAKGARYAAALAATDVARLAHEKAVAMVSNLL